MRPVYGVLLLALASCILVYLADRFFRNHGRRAGGPGFRERLRGWLDAVAGYEEEWEGDISDGRDVVEAVEQAQACARTASVPATWTASAAGAATGTATSRGRRLSAPNRRSPASEHPAASPCRRAP